MNEAELFLSTRTGGFIAGFCVAVGLVAAIVSTAFYFKFRKPYLMHFAVVVAVLNACMVLANKDPHDLADLKGDAIFFRLFHTMIMLAIYFYCRLLSATGEFPNTRPVQILNLTALMAILARFVMIVWGSPTIFPAVSVFTLVFLVNAIIVIYKWKPSDLSHKLCQLSALGMMSLIFYPLVRSGVLPKTDYEHLYIWFILGSVTISSVVWLLGLVQLAHEESEAVRKQEYVAREKAFYDLRDFMNNPLQVLLASVEVYENGKETELSQVMKRAVERLSKLNNFLGRYAKDSDWSKKKKFFDEKDLD